MNVPVGKNLRGEREFFRIFKRKGAREERGNIQLSREEKRREREF
jgi:hypothetical protein